MSVSDFCSRCSRYLTECGCAWRRPVIDQAVVDAAFVNLRPVDVPFDLFDVPARDDRVPIALQNEPSHDARFLITERPCMWCGKTFAEHRSGSPTPGEPRLRTPCLGYKFGFVAREKPVRNADEQWVSASVLLPISDDEDPPTIVRGED